MKKSAPPIIGTCHIYTNKPLIKLKASKSTTQGNEIVENEYTLPHKQISAEHVKTTQNRMRRIVTEKSPKRRRRH